MNSKWVIGIVTTAVAAGAALWILAVASSAQNGERCCIVEATKGDGRDKELALHETRIDKLEASSVETLAAAKAAAEASQKSLAVIERMERADRSRR